MSIILKIFQLISPDPTSPCQRCSASPEKSPDLRLVFLPRQTVDRAGHRLFRHPEILPLRGRFFAPVRIPAAKVSRIRTISEGSCFSREITCCSRTFTSPCWPRRSAGTFLFGVPQVRRKKGTHSLFPFFRSILPEGGANSIYLLSSMLIIILSTLV